MDVIDAKGLPCPQPVLLTKKRIKEGSGGFVVLVSKREQAANVAGYARSMNCSVQIEGTEEGYRVEVTGGEDTVETGMKDVRDASDGESPEDGCVLVINSRCMGSGDDELGEILTGAFMHTLTEIDVPPRTVILYNSGVKLAVKGSPVIDDLAALESSGADILVCGTCLDRFGLLEDVLVGRVSNMYTIAETILLSRKTVTI